MKPLRVLFFDIETAPLLAHIWHPAEGWVTHDRMLHDSFMLSWAAKWWDGETIYSNVLTPDEAKRQDDTRIVEGLADLVRKADIIIAHNIDKFDVPMLNNRLFLNGQEPLGPTKSIDTLKLARKHFRLAHNKLDYLAHVLGLGEKIKTDFSLWRRCYLGERSALVEMLRYNKHDVELLEQVFNKMVPYVQGLPALFEASHEMERGCLTCGSFNLQKRGKYRTKASVFQRYHCLDCGKYMRARTSDRNTKTGLVGL
jgi:hypothetical protein